MSQPFIEHVIEHYLARDKWRVAMIDYLARNGGRHQNGYVYVPAPSLYKYSHGSRDADLDAKVVHNTRESLKRSKDATVEHIHMMLHLDETLDEFSHVHQDGDIFHFVIHEVGDIPDLGDLL